MNGFDPSRVELADRIGTPLNTSVQLGTLIGLCLEDCLHSVGKSAFVSLRLNRSKSPFIATLSSDQRSEKIIGAAGHAQNPGGKTMPFKREHS
jgi:hypothetical protein